MLFCGDTTPSRPTLGAFTNLRQCARGRSKCPTLVRRDPVAPRALCCATQRRAFRPKASQTCYETLKAPIRGKQNEARLEVHRQRIANGAKTRARGRRHWRGALRFFWREDKYSFARRAMSEDLFKLPGQPFGIARQHADQCCPLHVYFGHSFPAVRASPHDSAAAHPKDVDRPAERLSCETGYERNLQRRLNRDRLWQDLTAVRRLKLRGEPIRQQFPSSCAERTQVK